MGRLHDGPIGLDSVLVLSRSLFDDLLAKDRRLGTCPGRRRLHFSVLSLNNIALAITSRLTSET